MHLSPHDMEPPSARLRSRSRVRPALSSSAPGRMVELSRGAFQRLVGARFLGWTLTAHSQDGCTPYTSTTLLWSLPGPRQRPFLLASWRWVQCNLSPHSRSSPSHWGPDTKSESPAPPWAPSRPCSPLVDPRGRVLVIRARGLGALEAMRDPSMEALGVHDVVNSHASRLAMDSDVVVIGSGPAGVSAAYELLAAGRRVTLLEAGAEPHAAGGVVPSAMRMKDRLCRSAPGTHHPSCERRWPRACSVTTTPRTLSQTDDFELMGSLAVGGLSNVWGAGVAEWTDEFDEWPEDARSTRDWYPRIADRMGVSGPKDDALTPHISPTISPQMPVEVSAPCSGLLPNTPCCRRGRRLPHGRSPPGRHHE